MLFGSALQAEDLLVYLLFWLSSTSPALWSKVDLNAVTCQSVGIRRCIRMSHQRATPIVTKDPTAPRLCHLRSVQALSSLVLRHQTAATRTQVWELISRGITARSEVEARHESHVSEFLCVSAVIHEPVIVRRFGCSRTLHLESTILGADRVHEAGI